MARSRTVADEVLTSLQESRVREIMEDFLVKLDLIKARRCRNCENYCPIGGYCFLYDDKIPESVLPVGCDEWKSEFGG